MWGVLGAGKTTLLWRAAELLIERGKRVGLITNDQAPDLVDTKWLAEERLNVREVAGSCFCCNFAGLIYAAEKLLAAGVDVLIGEPVGSCTDLSATILQPLKDRLRGQSVLSPLSVLADLLVVHQMDPPSPMVTGRKAAGRSFGLERVGYEADEVKPCLAKTCPLFT